MEWNILLQANVYMLMLTFKSVPNWPNDGMIKLLFVTVINEYNQFSFVFHEQLVMRFFLNNFFQLISVIIPSHPVLLL